MSTELPENIVANLDQIERGKYGGFRNAWVNAIKQHSSDTSSSSAKTVTDSKRLLEEFVDAVLTKYGQEEGQSGESAIAFRSQESVLEYLKNAGWKVSKSNLNRHCKEKLLRPSEDGTYSQRAVDRYAKTWLKQIATGQKVNERLDRLQEERLEKELKAANLKLDREQFELDIRRGRFIPRDEVEVMIVGRAVAFMAHLNHMVQSGAPDWIDLVEGNQGRSPELVAAICEAIEQRMGDFAADVEFDVILEANE